MILFLFLLLTALASAQQHQHEPAAKKPATLMPAMGNHHHAIQTSNPLAQKFFNQGMALTFGFNHDEAQRAFEHAAELDPKAAMPMWGVAYVLGPNINLPPEPDREKAAWEALQKALALREGAPAKERDYIEALAHRYSSDPSADRRKLAENFKNAMGELVKKYPDDLDLATLYAESAMNLRPWQLWNKSGDPAEGTEEIVSVLESVLRRDPKHIGANHYYIHAVEASRTPERALPSADRLRTLAPDAGHLVHMPGHIYLQLGEYEASASTNDKAAAADRRFIQRTGATGIYPMMYYSHNLHFIAISRAMQGRFAEAIAAAKQLSANVSPAVMEMPMLQGFQTIEYAVLERFRRWDDILKLSDPGEKLGLTRAFRHFVRGLAFAAKGQIEEAKTERAAYHAIREKLPPDTPFGMLNNAAAVFEVATAILDARIDRPNEIEHLRKAVAAQDALNYDEPPSWYYPARESLGAALLGAKRFDEAEQVFREDLKRNPRNGRSLVGLLEALQGGGKDAAWIQKQFDDAWKFADTKIKAGDL